MKIIRLIAIAALTVLTAAQTFAVTDKEMDNARAITAKQYLRYANNGSGYLDEFEVSSMSELTGKLKDKEKENLKAFNSVTVPKDYASWDKDKLIEFWAVTFFTSPALSDNGKAAKSSVRKKLSAMTVAAPAPAAEEPKAEEPTVAEAASEQATPTAESAVATQEDILKDQEAIEKDVVDAQPQVAQEEAHTWVYVLVLIILVAIVIWLVVYAANLMKRQTAEDELPATKGADTSDASLRDAARKAIAKKNEEVEELRRRLEVEENRAATIGAELERLRLDHQRAQNALDQAREENRALSAELATLRAGVRSAAAEPVRTQQRPAVEQSAPHREPVEDTRQPVRPRREESKPAAPANSDILRVIYLGRANSRGLFVRADRRLNPGNTIFRLDTNDGLVGTFHVIDRPEVVDVALSDPMAYLANGCLCDNDLEDTTGVNRIATESAGTAIFENGYWKVLRKTKIKYE